MMTRLTRKDTEKRYPVDRVFTTTVVVNPVRCYPCRTVADSERASFERRALKGVSTGARHGSLGFIRLCDRRMLVSHIMCSEHRSAGPVYGSVKRGDFETASFQVFTT